MLNKLLSKESINSIDYHQFIKSISVLTKYADGASFRSFSEAIKQCIGAFETIFGKSNNERLRKHISKSCNTVTRIYMTLLKNFYRFEPLYALEFYFHFKEILSTMDGSVRAKSFTSNIAKFKLVVEHLHMAPNRFEQMAILEILRLYTENVPIDTLNKLKLNEKGDYWDIIEEIVKLGMEPTARKRHAFLNRINLKNANIITLEPTKTILLKHSWSYCKPDCDVWLDCNLKDESLIFIALPSTHEEDQSLGIVSRPLIKLLSLEELTMTVNGKWSILKDGSSISSETMSGVMFCLPSYVQDMITQVKSVFKVLPHIVNFGDSNDMVDSETTTVIFFPESYNICNGNDVPSPKKKARLNESTDIQLNLNEDVEDSDSNSHIFSDVNDWTYILENDVTKNTESSSISVAKNDLFAYGVADLENEILNKEKGRSDNDVSEPATMEIAPNLTSPISDRRISTCSATKSKLEGKKGSKTDKNELSMIIEHRRESLNISVKETVATKSTLEGKKGSKTDKNELSMIIEHRRESLNISVKETVATKSTLERKKGSKTDKNELSMLIEHRRQSLNISVKETVNDAINTTNDGSEKNSAKVKSDDINRPDGDYRKRLRPKKKNQTNYSCDGVTSSTTTLNKRQASKRKKIMPKPVSGECDEAICTKNDKMLKMPIDTNLITATDCNDNNFIERIERCLSKMTAFQIEFNDKFSQIHEEVKSCLREFTERLQTS